MLHLELEARHNSNARLRWVIGGASSQMEFYSRFENTDFYRRDFSKNLIGLR
jgi:hypothetical protein